MKLHEHIVHHVRKHKERIVAHVNKYHMKYIAGAGLLSGAAVFKLVGILVIFLGASRMGGMLGADYYDADYYLLQQQSGEKITIGGSQYSDAISDITGCNATGDNNLSGTKDQCPSSNK